MGQKNSRKIKEIGNFPVSERSKKMISIRSEKFVKYENGLSVVRMEIDIDSADELPEVGYFSGRKLCQGSIAWDISTGSFYGLTSTGDWVLQTGGGENV